MAFSTSISPALRDAAELKIEELNHVKAAFEDRYRGASNVEITGDDVLGRLTLLLERVKQFLERDDDLPNLTRFVEQAQNDRSVSRAKLMKLEKDLRDKLEKHANRLEVSSLHIDLLKEALDAEESTASVTAKFEKAGLEDEFEMVEGELEAVLDKFEKNAFSTKEIDDKAIEEYLTSLFDSPVSKDHLSRIRQEIEDWGEDFLKHDKEIDEELLEWCVTDLLKNQLLSNEKKRVLQGYLQSPVAIRELTSTLNMKSIRRWNYRNVEKGLPVTARQNADGKYCITVEEDVIDMLFLHSIAVGWSMKLREVFKEAISFKGVWPGNKLLSKEELEVREFYLLGPRSSKREKSCAACQGPPPPSEVMDIMDLPPSRRTYKVPLPPPVYRSRVLRGREESLCPPPPPPPGPPNAILNDIRYTNYVRNFFVSRLPKRNGASPDARDADETQANLMKTLATEAKLLEALDGNASCLTIDYTSFASSLPHQTVLAVLKFIGMPQQWLGMFTRFLTAPLNIGPIVRGTPDQILARTCGIPVGHGLETFFSEAILFFLDLVVHQKTGGYLYRLRDRCHFVGKAQQRDSALQEMYQFSDVMGLNFRREDQVASNSIGFMHFNPIGDDYHGHAQHSIDNDKVEAYAHRVKKQLASCSTVFGWIRTWNNAIGEYKSHLFGPLANVFGKAHLEAVTEAHNRIHEIIFDGSNLTDRVRSLLTTHLNRPITDPPFAVEALIHLPTAYGGLGVKNPYVTINLAREVLEKPSSLFVSFMEDEKRYYDRALDHFNRMPPEKQQEKLATIFENDKQRIASVLGPDIGPAVFPSYSSLTSHRERAVYPILPALPYPMPTPYTPVPSLNYAYQSLLQEPVDEISSSSQVRDDVRRLDEKGEMKRWWQLSGEERWVLQLYGDECFERYGGLEVWCGESVPRELLRMVRGDGLDGAHDDASSVSCLTED